MPGICLLILIRLHALMTCDDALINWMILSKYIIDSLLIMPLLFGTNYFHAVVPIVLEAVPPSFKSHLP